MNYNYNYKTIFTRYSNALTFCKENKKKQTRLLIRACNIIKKTKEHNKDEVIESWSEKFNFPKSILEHYIRGKSSEIKSVDVMINFLNFYKIKENILSKELNIEFNHKKYTKAELKINVKDEMKKKFDNETFNEILDTVNTNITVVEQFNPLLELFDEIEKKYNGNKQIDRLASCFTAYDYGNPADYKKNQERFAKHFKKWLYLAAAQILGIKPNDGFLLLISGKGGLGKTKFFEWLYSIKEMKEYIASIDSREPNIKFAEILSSNILFNWEEFQLTKTKYEQFKSSLSKNSIKIYDKKIRKFRTYPRMCSLGGSSNKNNRKNEKGTFVEGYLHNLDGGIVRRIIPLELTNIDWQKYLREIDIEQLWGEAITGVKQELAKNPNYTWDKDDWADFEFHNAKYLITQNEISRPELTEIIRPTEDESIGTWISATEIKILLQNQNLNKEFKTVTALGIYMSSLKIYKKRLGKNKAYLVILNLKK